MIREMEAVCPLADLLSSSDLQVMSAVGARACQMHFVSARIIGAVHVIFQLVT